MRTHKGDGAAARKPHRTALVRIAPLHLKSAAAPPPPPPPTPSLKMQNEDPILAVNMLVLNLMLSANLKFDVKCVPANLKFAVKCGKLNDVFKSVWKCSLMVIS
jgi:hypothetical protein